MLLSDYSHQNASSFLSKFVKQNLTERCLRHSGFDVLKESKTTYLLEMYPVCFLEMLPASSFCPTRNLARNFSLASTGRTLCSFGQGQGQGRLTFKAWHFAGRSCWTQRDPEQWVADSAKARWTKSIGSWVDMWIDGLISLAPKWLVQLQDADHWSEWHQRRCLPNGGGDSKQQLVLKLQPDSRVCRRYQGAADLKCGCVSGSTMTTAKRDGTGAIPCFAQVPQWSKLKFKRAVCSPRTDAAGK